ncbi:poly-gamma-glutamate system protein [Candidatus Bipolaricaulota bacterium]
MLVFVGLIAIAIVLTVCLDRFERDWGDVESRATLRMASAFPILVSELASRGMKIDLELDPNRTGLIGEEFTLLTTTVGVLSSKRTSTNPAFAALLVRWLSQVDLDAGDRVLITLSGSFPALGIAAIIACEELGIIPVLVSSIGASMYGANRPDFTWLDIESALEQNGIIQHTSTRVTLGGEGDIGLSYPEGGREAALAAIERHNVLAILESDARAQWQEKLTYIEAADVSALINIGGNQLSIGPDGYLLAPGIVDRTALTGERFGLVGWFVERNLPVIHLLNIRELAFQYGLPQDPIPLPSL